LFLTAFAVLCAGFAYPVGARLLAANAFLGSLSGAKEQGNTALLREEELQITSAGSKVRARLYRPAGAGPHRGIVVAHGVHYQGIDERRLVPFARALAQSGLVVLTPELVDLADYRLTTSSVGTIADAVGYLAARRDLVADGRVGLLGFSFAGGLSLVAAERPELDSQLEYVVSVGGHHSLDRVFRFLLTSQLETPKGVVKFKAHDYGLAVVAYAYLDELLPAAEVAPAREAIRAWLQEDRGKARVCAASLSGEGLRLFRLLEEQKLAELAPQLRAVVEKHRRELSALSPKGKLTSIRVPVYLLHGSRDSVIPASEAEFADLELTGSRHEALVTPLIEHVEVNRKATLRERLSLLAFMAHLF
jgi:dienelactone hydrolase